MTNIERFTTVIEALVDRTVAGATLLKISNGLLQFAGEDTTGTNEVKAGLALAHVKRTIRTQYIAGVHEDVDIVTAYLVIGLFIVILSSTCLYLMHIGKDQIAVELLLGNGFTKFCFIIKAV